MYDLSTCGELIVSISTCWDSVVSIWVTAFITNKSINIIECFWSSIFPGMKHYSVHADRVNVFAFIVLCLLDSKIEPFIDWHYIFEILAKVGPSSIG